MYYVNGIGLLTALNQLATINALAQTVPALTAPVGQYGL
eukprot:XP_001707047.1 Hypothetical protein GL50803_28498 [Giardia lamblia ATCC 50803]